MTFTEWMRELDSEMRLASSIVSSDLPDKPYRDWLDEGLTPSQAAMRALNEEGFPG